jgi:hypothetical protein
MKIIINCETGEENYEELTAEDIAQQKKDEAEAAKPKVITDPFELAHLAAKQSAQAKLAALGLTEEEVASILG